MPTLSTVIMAHPRRSEQVAWLRGRLDCDPPVVWDRHNDRWDTGRRALLAYDPAASHHLVVQDDAMPCRDLTAGLLAALPHVPADACVSLYAGKPRPKRQTVGRAVRHARTHGHAWARFRGPWWGLALVLPTAHIPRLVEWCDPRPESNYDTRIGAFYRGRDCWYTMPSLVEHRGDEPSLVPGRTSQNRFAFWFVGHDVSALTVDWSRVPDRAAV